MSLHSRLLLFFLLFIPSSALLPLQTASLTPVSKDPSTLQYIVSLLQKTPLKPTKLLLDLGASFNWLDCHNFVSSTYQHVPCNSSLCSSLPSLSCSNCYNAPGPACANQTCALFPENPLTRTAAIGYAIVDSLALPTTDGRNPSRLGLISQFVFSCSSSQSILKGLANTVTGLASLGQSNFSLPAQIGTAFSAPYVFAMCLSGSPSAPGIVFYGTRGPYFFLPEIDISKSLIYTPLLLNPIGSTVINYHGRPSDEYFVNVTSLRVNGKPVGLNPALLIVDQNGIGGTKISTLTPYTTLQTSIYTAFTEAFVNEAAALNLTVTNAIKPFNVCYSADDVVSTRAGPGVPTVDLVMHSEDVFWRIFGSNSMVRMAGANEEDVWCLGFLDGGANARTAIVIGGHQMEDNLLEFDVESQKLGFSSSVLVRGTMCANFNFTSNV